MKRPGQCRGSFSGFRNGPVWLELKSRSGPRHLLFALLLCTVHLSNVLAIADAMRQERDPLCWHRPVERPSGQSWMPRGNLRRYIELTYTRHANHSVNPSQSIESATKVLVFFLLTWPTRHLSWSNTGRAVPQIASRHAAGIASRPLEHRELRC